MQDYFGAWNFLSNHIHVGGWILLIIFAWKASSRFEKFTRNVSEAEKVAKESGEVVNKVATNHLPHLQEAVDNLNTNIGELKSELISELKGIRSDLLQYALRKD